MNPLPITEVNQITDNDLINFSQDIVDLNQVDLNKVHIYIRQNMIDSENGFTIHHIDNLYNNVVTTGHINKNNYEFHTIEKIDITEMLSYLYRYATPTTHKRITEVIDLMYPRDQLFSTETHIRPLHNTEYNKQ